MYKFTVEKREMRFKLVQNIGFRHQFFPASSLEKGDGGRIKLDLPTKVLNVVSDFLELGIGDFLTSIEDFF